MKVLVTGSAGFIGQAVVKKLTAAGHQVAGLDKSPGTASDNQCDILDAARLSNIVQGLSPDAVIHLAARIDIDETAGLEGYAANVAGVENLVGAIRSTPSIKRAVWTSSQLVCRVGYVPREETEYNPNTIYGQSKVRTEQIVRAEDGGGREWCLVRPTTVWGPGMSAHYQRFLRMIQRGYYFHVGHRPLWKSYSYVGNIAHQYLRLLEAPAYQIHQRTFYLADYQPIDLLEWCDAFQRGFQARKIPHLPLALARILARCGDAVNALGKEGFPFNSFRLNNVLTQYRFDTRATEAVCGPLPFTMEQGVAETLSWFQEAMRLQPNPGSPKYKHPRSEPAES
jgi:nucleoside-diphosphate-sugar epimerase